MTPANLRAIEGDGWATGLIELQAVEASAPARIATIRCTSAEEAEAAGRHLLGQGRDLIMLCIVFDADRGNGRTIDLLKEAS